VTGIVDKAINAATTTTTITTTMTRFRVRWPGFDEGGSAEAATRGHGARAISELAYVRSRRLPARPARSMTDRAERAGSRGRAGFMQDARGR
jgi:hypothetical protein